MCHTCLHVSHMFTCVTHTKSLRFAGYIIHIIIKLNTNFISMLLFFAIAVDRGWVVRYSRWTPQDVMSSELSLFSVLHTLVNYIHITSLDHTVF